MQSEGPRRGEGGGDDVEGLLKTSRVGGGADRETARDWREKQEGRRGRETLAAAAAAAWQFLYTPWQLGAGFLAGLGKWVTQGRSSAQTLAQEHPTTERPGKHLCLWQSSLHPF